MVVRRLVAGERRRSGRHAAALNRRQSDVGNGKRAPQEFSSLAGLNGESRKNPGITQADGSEQLSGAALLHQAMAVAAAADAYSARGRSNVSALTLQFLIGRSLELALKAYLTNKDCAECSLKKNGLDLSKLLQQAAAHSFELYSGTSDADRRAVAALGPNYMRKMIECHQADGHASVTSKVLREILNRAIVSVFTVIWNEDPVRFNLRRTSDRALGLSIADDACYEEYTEVAGYGPDAIAIR